MRVSLFLARRFLAGRSGSLLGTVSTLALLGVALGAAALVVAMGLMSGYRNDLAEKLAGTNAEVLVMPDDLTGEEKARGLLARLPGVTAVARTAFAPGLLRGHRIGPWVFVHHLLTRNAGQVERDGGGRISL